MLTGQIQADKQISNIYVRITWRFRFDNFNEFVPMKQTHKIDSIVVDNESDFLSTVINIDA